MSLLSPPLPPTSFSIVDPSWVLCACHQRNEPQTIQVSVKLARPTVGYAENNCLVSKVNDGFYSQIEDYKPTEINWGLGLAKKKTSPSKPSCPASERTPHTHLREAHSEFHGICLWYWKISMEKKTGIDIFDWLPWQMMVPLTFLMVS